MKLSAVVSTTFENISKYFEEYTGTTAIHGVQFIGNRRRSYVERFLWLVIVAVSVVLCSKYVMQTYSKWQSSPVYVTIGTGQLPIHDVSFPAVTICPETRTDTDIFSYPDVLAKMFANDTNANDTEKLQFEYMSVICNRSETTDGFLQENYFDVNMLHFAHNVTPKFNETFIECRFANSKEDCSKMFTPIFTREGICYSFNILDRSELYRENIQHFRDYHTAKNSTCFKEPLTKKCKNVYPNRASFSGIDSGLEVELRTSAKDLDFKCASPLQGFKVIIHNPSEIPTRSHNYFRLPLDQAVFAALTPQIIMTKENLRSYTSQQRQCYFDDEKSLLRFKYYTESNCEIECLSYLLINTIDCLDFYLPHTNETKNICGAQYLQIIKLLEKLLVSYVSNTTDLNLSVLEVYVKQMLKELNNTKDIDHHCECLPSCTSVEYTYETTQTDYFWYLFKDGEKGVRRKQYRSLLNMYFQDARYIPMQREEMFGSMDFIAYCGGLLGLFIGFSFISLMEIVYFLTLRIGCNVRMYGRKLWHGSDD